jgi:hypothetical protein
MDEATEGLPCWRCGDILEWEREEDHLHVLIDSGGNITDRVIQVGGEAVSYLENLRTELKDIQRSYPGASLEIHDPYDQSIESPAGLLGPNWRQEIDPHIIRFLSDEL